MGLTKQHIQAAQGALFLIDHIGKAPLGTPFRQYTDQAIAEHLKKHTYYYQQNNLPGPSNRKPVTLQWMRKYLLGLLAKVNNSFYQPRLHRDDAADTLFRKGTTEGFSHALLTKYGYNKANFSESDLPGYAEVESEAGNDEDADGEIETLDGEEGQRNENEADAGTARRQVQATQVEVAAPFFPPPSNGHNPSFTSAKDDNDELSSEDSEDLGDDDGNDRYFDGNEYLDAFNPNKSGLQVVIETTAPSPAKATPVSLKKVKSEIEDTEPAIARTEPPKKRGRPRKQAAIPATQPARSSFPSAAEGSSISQLSSDTTFVHAAQEQAVSENASFPLPGKPNSMSQPLRNIADSKEAIQEQVRTWVGSAKRKRESVDFDSMINSSEDDSATRSAKRKNSKLANKVGPEPAHHGTVVPNATLPFKPTFATSVPTSTDATLREGLPKDTRPAAKEVRDPQSFQTSVPSQVPETKHQPAPFRTDEQARNFENFYQMIQVATDQVIASIGDLGSSLSFLDPIPSNRLESLYVRCWGPHWEAVRLKLTKDYVFTVPEVTMSLISAFLYNNVCNQHASAQDIQAKQLELRGTTGRAILRILDLNNDGQRLAEVVRTIESEDARVRLAQDDKVLQEQLRSKAEKYTQELWSVIVPHFRGLSRLAQGHGVSSHRSERDWLEVFTPVFNELIEAILGCRLKLLATGCEHVYTWPDTSVAYDLREMDIHGAKLQSPLQVLFTVFPGVKVTVPGSTTMRALTGMKAMVKVRKA